jgi:hypothetical protein
MPTANRDPAAALTLQLLAWIAERERSYAEVMEAWRTSCPRLSIWEDACSDGLIDRGGDGGRNVRLSDKGRAVLDGQPGRRGDPTPAT